MIIDFSKMEETVTPHFKGGDGTTAMRTFNDGQNKIMMGRLDVGCSIGYHTHETSSETILILSGEARIITEKGEEVLQAGQCHYCAKHSSHSMINNSRTQPLTYFAIVPEQ
ncbi:MAG: cupin domain-containing protein [Bacteroidales bacterium]|nr:cupin domain-containing protein [Bacteroidales bacterium]